jgi:hypothetical protein
MTLPHRHSREGGNPVTGLQMSSRLMGDWIPTQGGDDDTCAVIAPRDMPDSCEIVTTWDVRVSGATEEKR